MLESSGLCLWGRSDSPGPSYASVIAQTAPLWCEYFGAHGTVVHRTSSSRDYRPKGQIVESGGSTARTHAAGSVQEVGVRPAIARYPRWHSIAGACVKVGIQRRCRGCRDRAPGYCSQGAARVARGGPLLILAVCLGVCPPLDAVAGITVPAAFHPLGPGGPLSSRIETSPLWSLRSTLHSPSVKPALTHRRRRLHALGVRQARPPAGRPDAVTGASVLDHLPGLGAPTQLPDD